MSKATDLQFLQSIKDIYDPIFRDYGFELQGEPTWSGQGEYLVTATHGEIALNFYLTVIPLSPICYCTLAIMLFGKLAQKATSNKDQHHTSLDVINIAEVLNSDYQRPSGEIQTNKDLRQILEIEKECLLRYCRSVLSGDVSIWSKVVKGLNEKRGR